MSRLLNLQGARFTRLLVISRAPSSKRGQTRWNCSCDCGTLLILRGHQLREGSAKSCGCLRIELSDVRVRKHGYYGTVEYTCWAALIGRCTNKNNRAWKDYGGRGITVCERWRTSFENFLQDVGERPTPKHSIDRWPNNDGNYEPGNARWASKKEQANNRRSRK